MTKILIFSKNVKYLSKLFNFRKEILLFEKDSQLTFFKELIQPSLQSFFFTVLLKVRTQIVLNKNGANRVTFALCVQDVIET